MADVSREEIDRSIAAGDAGGARKMLGAFWRASPGQSAAGYVVSRFEQLRPRLSLISCKLAILRSFTIEPAIPLLRAMAFVAGIDLEVRLGDFNTYAQDVLNAGGWLYSFAPDAVIVAVQTRDLIPTLWNDSADLDREHMQTAISSGIESFRQLIDAFRSHSKAHLIIHALQVPALPAMGLLDARIELGQQEAIRKINDALVGLARAAKNVCLLDYNALIARRGEAAWQDERKWLLARMPIAAGELIHLAREWMRFVHPITGRVCKVIAVDLDNTLWGGVIGEDGMDGIKLDDQYPGAAYRALQRAILDLSRRGIVLAICSKNNPPEAAEAIEKHPNMLLRLRHFAVVRINWADKATNLREIAKELNVGIDSVAFLDDNPVERQWIAEQAPEVTVIELPGDPMLYAQALRESPVFERLELTDEDKSRGQFYAEQRMRIELEQTSSSLEDFYRSLRMQVKIEPVNPKTLARAAQLTQKTNQFNLTTRRYTEQQLGNMLASPRWRAFTLQVVDRFGDNGIVGVALLSCTGAACDIDTLLLSCRVIGRTVETAFLAALANEAIQMGASRLTGWFIPTKKNAPARDFYPQHGFVAVRQQEGQTLWELGLGSNLLSCPAWIELEGSNT